MSSDDAVVPNATGGLFVPHDEAARRRDEPREIFPGVDEVDALPVVATATKALRET